MPAEGSMSLLLASVLHYGDSSFPSGGFAFSSGLEGLVMDGLVVTVDDIEAFLADLLHNRWTGFDALALRRAYHARSVHEITVVDSDVEIATFSAPQRAGSKRAGRALLSVHAKLGSATAAAYREQVLTNEELGHLPVVQGFVWREAGLPIEAALVMGAWGMVQGVSAAAIRLGLIGHLEAQQRLSRMRPVVATAVEAAADRPLDAPLSSFLPLAEIALERHERRDVRMFVT